MSSDEHRAAAGSGPVRCVVLTSSDTRTEADDHSGDLIAALLVQAGHEVTFRAIVREDRGLLAEAFENAAVDADAVLITGGTGLSSRDGTVEVIEPRLDRLLPGFGELFRMLSYQEIGPAAMLSRALAGSYGETMVFALPGSAAAVRLAMEKLILPELRHLLRELKR